MKLEKFKPKNPKKVGIIVFTVACIFLVAGVFFYTSFASFEVKQDFNIINGTVGDPGDLYFVFYVDNKISKTMPQKGEGYVIDQEKTTCNNGASVEFNETDWSVKVLNMTTSRTKCTLYFVKGIVGQIIDQLDTTGKCPTVSENGTVNISKIESTNSYVCSAPDDYGTSYYFRGNVENNWVKFAGYYWRILRMNGDSSIRIIYAGDASVIDALDNKEEVLKNGYNDRSTDYTQIGESAFNSISNDNAYFGYMYGTPGSSTYDETHKNTNDSTIKEKVDEWYESHIKETEYEQYIADTLFCNDRSFSSSNSGTGIGTSGTYYRHTPTLYCQNQNDRFTINDEVKGNKALNYPIGLLTADELQLAGGYDYAQNSNYYLYTGNNYWTISPMYFDTSYSGARGWYVNSAGGLFDGDVTWSYGIRPVINLKPDSLNFGDGSASNPYRVD